MATSSRSTEVDTIRAAALIGICVVNVPFLGLPAIQAVGTPQGTSDRFAAFAVEFLFQGKFFLLFSFVFGWGVELQSRAAARASASFGRRYFRRLAALAVLGCLHAALVFPGDILLIYAILGVLLWPCRNMAPRRLLMLAFLMIVVELLTLGALAFVTQGTAGLPQPSGGSVGQGVLARVSEWPETLGFLLLFQGPLAFGAFLAGLASAKSRFFEPDSDGRRRLGRSVPWLWVLAIPANLAFAIFSKSEGLPGLVGFLSFAVGAPSLAAIYLHMLVKIDAAHLLPKIVRRAGQNSLTAYVLQGVIAGTVFGGYGLGWFGALGQLQLIPLAIVLATLSMMITSLAALVIGYGPLELLLRRMTYHGEKSVRQFTNA
ncbi:DUF418 domain-containing protein (plasmid) [Bosea sp. F3-2]|uniref:DUF418 domain-containing protein n=1 Tax=Bosea sp. F3-2 TaxID=2599640 RepID=UPI0011EBB061|nr:DUF418 domain-containing protein [Bosea sp. F3-2]QEL26898.1 DUF418 domain-containing protein [Bosea sp. F3-2]